MRPEMKADSEDLQHHLFYLTLDGKLYLAPIAEEPRRVLDIATGSGIWAIDFGKTGDLVKLANLTCCS